MKILAQGLHELEHKQDRQTDRQTHTQTGATDCITAAAFAGSKNVQLFKAVLIQSMTVMFTNIEVDRITVAHA